MIVKIWKQQKSPIIDDSIKKMYYWRWSNSTEVRVLALHTAILCLIPDYMLYPGSPGVISGLIVRSKR